MAIGLWIFLPVFFLAILSFVFWIIILIDAITRTFKKDSDRIVWVLVILLTSIIGALIYYFVIYNKEKSLKWFWWTLLVLVLWFILSVVVFFSVSSPLDVQRIG